MTYRQLIRPSFQQKVHASMRLRTSIVVLQNLFRAFLENVENTACITQKQHGCATPAAQGPLKTREVHVVHGVQVAFMSGHSNREYITMSLQGKYSVQCLSGSMYIPGATFAQCIAHHRKTLLRWDVHHHNENTV